MSETFCYFYLEPATADGSRRVGSEKEAAKDDTVIETRHRFEATRQPFQRGGEVEPLKRKRLRSQMMVEGTVRASGGGVVFVGW